MTDTYAIRELKKEYEYHRGNSSDYSFNAFLNEQFEKAEDEIEYWTERKYIIMTAMEETLKDIPENYYEEENTDEKQN